MPWTPFTVAAPAGTALPDDTVTYGPDIATEAGLHLLGDVAGKRVLDVGCGAGHNVVALARAGARAIGVEPDQDQLAEARRAAEAAEVRVELHHGPLAELAFLRADTVDLAISVFALATVDDIGRVFRQVHRVLKPQANFVLSLPHPFFALLDPDDPDPLRVRRNAFDDHPYGPGDPRHGTFARSLGTLCTELYRAGFTLNQVLEPRSISSDSPHWTVAMTQVPATLILRARKEGL